MTDYHKTSANVLLFDEARLHFSSKITAEAWNFATAKTARSCRHSETETSCSSTLATCSSEYPMVHVAQSPPLVSCIYISLTEVPKSGIYPSATRRVTIPESALSNNPDKLHMTQARYSIPFFCMSHDEMIVSTAPSCISAERPRQYNPIIAKEYAGEMSKWQYPKDGGYGESEEA